MENINELWLPIKGYESFYEISNLGKVKSLKRAENFFRKGKIIKRIRKEKILIPCYSKGYHIVSLCKDGKSEMKKIHRLVAIAFLPNIENKKQVNHIDCNKINNSFFNLEWTTHTENDNHATKNKLHPFGERNGRAKLTAIKIEEIRSKYNSKKYTYLKLANEYKISLSQIFRIIKNQAWNL
jgi:hypothetical protein